MDLAAEPSRGGSAGASRGNRLGSAQSDCPLLPPASPDSSPDSSLACCIRDALKGGFDAAFDGIGEHGFSRTWRAVGPRGHLSAFGVSFGIQGNISILRVGFWLAKLWWWNAFSGGRSTHWFVTDLGQLLGMLKRGEIKPRVAERIGLDAVADAHMRIERGGLEGKVVLVPNG